MNEKTRNEITGMIDRLERISLEEITDNEVANEIETALEALRNALEVVPEPEVGRLTPPKPKFTWATEFDDFDNARPGGVATEGMR